MTPALLLLALSNMIFFALHIGTVGSFPKPLSKEEEVDCLRRIREGDSAAKHKLIEHNLRLVAYIVNKNYPDSNEQDDLIFAEDFARHGDGHILRAQMHALCIHGKRHVHAVVDDQRHGIFL